MTMLAGLVLVFLPYMIGNALRPPRGLERSAAAR